MENTYKKEYYLQADCNFGKKMGLCDSDDTKSDTSLSTKTCKNYLNVNIAGVVDDMKCCYLSGNSLKKMMYRNRYHQDILTGKTLIFTSSKNDTLEI